MEKVKNLLTKVNNFWLLGTYKAGYCYRGVLIIIYSLFVMPLLSNLSYADGNYRNIFDAATGMINDVKGQMIAISGALAAVGVGTGVFMKKLSMGKQDKIELGNKIIKDSIVGWFVLNSITYILAYLSNFTSDSSGTSGQ